MENVLAVFSNPIVIIAICVAFGLPILAGVLRFIQKKVFKKNTGNARDAQHVRDVVKKFDEKNAKRK